MNFSRPVRNVIAAFSPAARPTEACELPEWGGGGAWRKWLNCIIQVIYHLAYPIDGDLCLQLLAGSFFQVRKEKKCNSNFDYSKWVSNEED